ncbi:MAG: ABC transporter ATP-binding protein [Vulcanimicrobiota bacterium]
MDKPAVRLDGIVKRFDQNTIAVSKLNLEIGRGEFFSLLGPSGCGKTTTLRMIAGFEEPSEGEIYIAGEKMSGVPAYRRNVNTVFQNYALFPHLNVFENVAFGLRRQGVKASELNRRTTEALGLVRLEEYGKRRISQLSGGQKQRVALARALVNRPEVLLLDEPMGALDSQLRKDMRRELKQLQREVGITFVLVTHDQEEALTMSDRVAVLRAGKLQQVCSPRDLYDNPENRFVAEFIGEVNLLPVRILAVDNGQATVDFAGGQLRVPLRNGFTRGDHCELALRPERVTLAEKPGPEASNHLKGRVLETSFLGPVTRQTVEIEGGQTIVAEHLSSDAGPGDGEVYISWDPTSGSLLHGDE